MSNARPVKLKRGDVHPETGLFYWSTVEGWPYYVSAVKLAELRRKASARANAWKKRNPDWTRNFARTHYYKNHDHKLAMAKRRYAANPEKRLSANRKYEVKNRLALKQSRRAYWNNRYKEDPLYRLIHLSRGRVANFLRWFGASKDSRTFAIIGCTPEFLRAYLEVRFQPGMTWENYGVEWHVDHHIPLSSAKTTREAKKLCHYSNLNPMWASQNIAKAAKTATQLQLI